MHLVIMEEGEDLLKPQSTWGLRYSIGRRVTTSALRILNVSRRIPCAAGVLSPRACVTTGEDGNDPTLSSRGLRKSSFKVCDAADPLFHKLTSMILTLFYTILISLCEILAFYVTILIYQYVFIQSFDLSLMHTYLLSTYVRVTM